MPWKTALRIHIVLQLCQERYASHSFLQHILSGLKHPLSGGCVRWVVWGGRQNNNTTSSAAFLTTPVEWPSIKRRRGQAGGACSRKCWVNQRLNSSLSIHPLFESPYTVAGTSPNVILQLEGLLVKCNHRWQTITSSTTARYSCNLSFVASGHTGGVLSSFYHYHLGWTGIKRHTINVDYLTRFVKEPIVSEG